MKIDKWIGNCKVTGFPWIDKERYYINVQYFKNGQSIEKPPVWDKSVYITMNEKYLTIIKSYLDSLVNYISRLDMPESGEVTLTF